MTLVRFKKQAWIVACIVLADPALTLAQSTEFIANEGPAPDSVEELHGPFVSTFPEAEAPPAALLGSSSEWLNELPPFWSDMCLDANFRTYYFLPAAGIGIRFVLSQKHRVGLSADLAVGNDGAEFYFGVGETFFVSTAYVVIKSRHRN
jgi:hypothetical protein